ncbi:MAG: hypothetical protein OQL28_03515 [Sedimenticola sp.]|nr:hypothetical protein [Sedimenticola sp.]
MGKKQHFQHIGSQSVMGLVMLITASTTALGTTSGISTRVALDRFETAVQQELVIAAGGNEAIQRRPACTPGFVCNAPSDGVQRVSRRQALQFALLIGTGASR